MVWICGGEDACRGSLGEGAGKIIARERAPAEGPRMPRGRGWITGEGTRITGAESRVRKPGGGGGGGGACSRAGYKEGRRARAEAGCREEDARGRGHGEALWTPSLCS
jgi:hypothetical protein